MSSAILYLAIVVIWAGVLMPRWLRAPGAQPVAEDGWDGLAEDGPADIEAPGEPLNSGSAGPPADDDGLLLGGHVPSRRERAASPERVAPSERVAPPGRAASPGRRGRARVLQARRRTLAALILLNAGAVAIATSHLAAFWVIIPPAVMLAGLILLLCQAARSDQLRQAARSDTGRAAARHDDVAPGTGIQAETPGLAHGGAQVPAEPTAQIIDISDRAGDHFYDQYTDALERAVGD